MKKLYQSSKLQKLYKVRNDRKLRKERFRAGVKKAFNKKNSGSLRNFYFEIRNKRNIFLKKFFRPQLRSLEQYNLPLTGKIGLEENFESFISFSQSLLSLNHASIRLLLDDVSRLWPSTIMMLCSFKQWHEITRHPSQRGRLSSSDPASEQVESYLQHSGFYKYVGRRPIVEPKHSYDEDYIVKIRRETKRQLINTRENEIINLIKKFSALTDKEVEIFSNNVLPEVFNNVTEHGITYTDSGWWTMSQYHPTTGIISVSIADNGIGIKNTLLTGPQSKFLEREIGKDAEDHHYLEKAINNNISGAITATVIQDTFLGRSRLDKGSHRGQGLQIISEKCSSLPIELTLISRRCYLKIANGESKFGTTTKDAFSGTLFHFKIPARIA